MEIFKQVNTVIIKTLKTVKRTINITIEKSHFKTPFSRNHQ